jgi:cytochrome c2
MRSARLPASLLLAAALLAGCGSGPASPGARIFAESCRSCHTLSTDARVHTAGGTVAGYGMSLAQLESFTRVMPVRLTPAEVRAVSRYLLGFQ